MKTNWLANIFEFQREVIEAAEDPFAKLAIFVLPVLAPLVPAFLTGLHLFKLFTDMFTFAYVREISASMSVIIAVVLELLGYVGAITFVRAVFDLINNEKKESYWLPVAINGLAYSFYVAIMFLINVKLGQYFNTPSIINGIFGLLSFITIPTGLLAANHLSQKAESIDKEKKYQEQREDKLKKYAIKHGMDPNLLIQEDRQKRANKAKNQRPASHFKEPMLRILNDAYMNKKPIPTVMELAKKFNLDYDRSKGFISGLRSEWMKQHNLK